MACDDIQYMNIYFFLISHAFIYISPHINMQVKQKWHLDGFW